MASDEIHWLSGSGGPKINCRKEQVNFSHNMQGRGGEFVFYHEPHLR